TLIPSATDLAKALEPVRQLKHLSLGIIPLDADTLSAAPSLPNQDISAPPGSLSTLAPIFRAACPKLESFRCLVPLATRPGGKRPFAEFYEVARARWSNDAEGWECTRERTVDGIPEIFGMIERA
ncbi:hypothetical protein FRC07_007646, partial [Ceratobasidium sp. 392]